MCSKHFGWNEQSVSVINRLPMVKGAVLSVLKLVDYFFPLCPIGVWRLSTTISLASPLSHNRPPIFYVVGCKPANVHDLALAVIHQFVAQGTRSPAITGFDVSDCLTCSDNLKTYKALFCSA